LALPNEVVYYLTMPAYYRRQGMLPAEYEALVRDAVRAECERIHAARNAPVLGVKKALSLSVDTRPTKPDDERDEPGHRFRFCSPEQVQEFLEAWVEWVAVYVRMRKLWTSGRRKGVLFPAGTDNYRRLEDAPTGDLDDDSPFAWNYP